MMVLSIEQGRNLRQWRLTYNYAALGACNMSRDEAILAAVSSGAAPPTLRLYGWQPPCLSLGYGQRSRDADTEHLAKYGWEIVRRPTGGSAILHADELTYSLALPIDHPLARGSVVESYERISAALLLALKRLGAHVEADHAGTESKLPNPVCFVTPSHYEITVGARKLVGSAQVRRQRGILQHGTLPLTGDITRICDALAYPDEAARDAAKAQVRASATTLEAVLGRVVDWQTAAETVAQGFAEAFNVVFQHADLTPAELSHAAELSHERFANPEWTFRR